MAEIINVASKQTGDMLTAGEMNTIVSGTNAAIEELNEVAGTVAEIQEAILTLPGPSEPETGATIKAKLEELTDEKRLDASAIKNLPVGGGVTSVNDQNGDVIIEVPTSSIVEWAMGDDKPTVTANRVIGEFVEGKMHFVTIATVGEETVAVIQVENRVDSNFTAIILPHNPFPLSVFAVAVDGNKILVGGIFDGWLKRLNTDGSEDETFMSTINNTVKSIHVDNGSYYVAGEFANTVVKLNNDGTIDDSFSSQIPKGSYNATVHYALGLKMRDDGLLMVWGYCSITNGMHGFLYLLNADGSLVDTFIPFYLLNKAIQAATVDPEGYIYVGFGSNFGLRKLTPTGVLEDTAFNNTTGYITALEYDPTYDSILVGGAYPCLLRYDKNGIVDTSFSTHELVGLLSINLCGNEMYIGGSFGIKKIDVNTGVEIRQFATLALDGAVRSIAVDAGGNILIGGEFSGYLRRLDPTSGRIDGKEVSFIGEIVTQQISLENRITAIENKLAAGLTGTVSASSDFIVSEGLITGVPEA